MTADAKTESTSWFCIVNSRRRHALANCWREAAGAGGDATTARPLYEMLRLRYHDGRRPLGLRCGSQSSPPSDRRQNREEEHQLSLAGLLWYQIKSAQMRLTR